MTRRLLVLLAAALAAVACAAPASAAIDITAPADGAAVSGVVAITAETFDSTGSVEFFVDGVLLGRDPDAPWAWSWDSASVSDGPHVIRVDQRRSGSVKAQASVSVDVQNGSEPPPPPEEEPPPPPDPPSGSFAAFGASQGFLSAFSALYPEPRACASSQEWWLEGPGDVTASILDAMRASHLHYETCFPFMETWNEADGELELDIQVLAHEYQGGTIKSVGGLGFLDGGSQKTPFQPVWEPAAANEVRNVTLRRDVDSLDRCGRVESRSHVEGLSPNGGERQFNSNGWQSLFECKAGRSGPASDRGPAIIFRGWYEGADYCNVTFADDNRGAEGFRASEMDDPVVGDLRLSVQNGSCSGVRWFVSVNPDIHGGSYGSWRSPTFASGGGTVTIPDSEIPAGVFRVMAVACERVGSSSANPNGGQNCGVGVIPFRGDGA